jgi:hypothetical protein
MITRRFASHMLATVAVGLLAGSAYGSAISIPVSADAHIDGTNVTANFGTATVLSIEQTALGGNKAYLLFDASGWGTTNIARVEGLRVFWSASLNITRTLWCGLITGTGANDWTEDGITWENAPANNVTAPDRNFAAYPEQVVTQIGTIQYSAGSPRELVVPFAEYSAEEYALLYALNYGDRKATIGVRYNSSQNNSVGLYSKEYEVEGVPGVYAATLQVVPEVPPGTPVSFVLQPQATIVTNGPYRQAIFVAEAYGSLPIYYQWLTNGVEVYGATGTLLKLPAETTDLNGTLVSVRIQNHATPDPGIVSSNALLTIVEAPIPDGILYANADVYFSGDTVYNAYNIAGQVWYGLTASGGATMGATARSYIGFTFGTQPVSSATLRLFQYWGGPEVNFSGNLAKGEIRVFGSTNALSLTEPPAGTGQTWPDNPEYAAPNNTNFVRVTFGPDQVVGPDLGWYDFDITDFYNANLGKPTVIRLAGVRLTGYDEVRFEDRENSAHNGFAGGTWPNTGPRIEYVLPPPWIQSADVVGNELVITGVAPRNPSETFYLLAAPDLSLPLSSWTAIATNQFDANGNFSISTPLDPGAASRFYRLQVPAP